jgi:hypothetical protein
MLDLYLALCPSSYWSRWTESTSRAGIVSCVGRSFLHLTCFQFYDGQANAYDTTREGLLRGRETMLSLSAAHLKSLRTAESCRPLVWIDIGGGTGILLSFFQDLPLEHH